MPSVREPGQRKAREPSATFWSGTITWMGYLSWEALKKMSQFWRRYGIDMLREAISLPGLAFKFEISLLKDQGLHLSSFHTDHLYQLYKNDMVGGPAIIFHHHAEKDKTKIRETQYGEAARPVQKVIGYDANALYLWSLSQRETIKLQGTAYDRCCQRMIYKRPNQPKKN